MIENTGIMLTISLPPYGFTFGLHPGYWSLSRLQVETECNICHGVSQANMLRVGPFTFVVMHHSHDDH